MEQTAVLGDELVVLSPNGLNPFAEGTELAQTGPTTFKTVNDSPYNARGEDITFSTNEFGEATEMQWASLPFFRA